MPHFVVDVSFGDDVVRSFNIECLYQIQAWDAIEKYVHEQIKISARKRDDDEIAFDNDFIVDAYDRFKPANGGVDGEKLNRLDAASERLHSFDN